MRLFVSILTLLLCCQQGIAQAEGPYGTATNVIEILANQRSFNIIPRSDRTDYSFSNVNPFLPDRFITISIWNLNDSEEHDNYGSAFGAGDQLWNLIPRGNH